MLPIRGLCGVGWPLLPSRALLSRRHYALPVGDEGGEGASLPVQPPYRHLYEQGDALRTNIQQRHGQGLEHVDRFRHLYEQREAVLLRTRELRTQRNNLKKQGGQAHKTGQGAQQSQVAQEGSTLKALLKAAEAEERATTQEIQQLASLFPNDTHPDTPIGAESEARLLRAVDPLGLKEQARGPHWQDHLAFLQAHQLADFERGSAVTGNKFCYLQGDVALLELALIHWAMGHILAYQPPSGARFLPVAPPDLAQAGYVSACGFAPRGEHSQVYRVAQSPLCLIGTAEIPLAGLHADRLIPLEQLPVRLVGYSHCFRAETGVGVASKGLYRLHQFSKVEMFVIASAQQSDALLEELVGLQESVVQALGLPYRLLEMPTQELGASAYRKYDIEAWMPSREAYGEISSASNCTDYQSRRMNMRYQVGKGDNHYAHTLNATALAVPRIILAILENFQQPDGRVAIPPVLWPYMHGRTTIPSSSPSSSSSENKE